MSITQEERERIGRDVKVFCNRLKMRQANKELLPPKENWKVHRTLSELLHSIELPKNPEDCTLYKLAIKYAEEIKKEPELAKMYLFSNKHSR